MTAVTLVAAVFCVVLYDISLKPYETPKELLLCVAGTVLFAYWSIFDLTFHVPFEILVVITALCGWWLICSTLSRNIESALAKTVRFCICVFVALLCVACDAETCFKLLAISACLNASVAILRWVRIPLPILPETPHCVGLAGNTNLLGAYLVPNLFVCLYLEWYIAMAVIAIGIAASKCRGSFLSACFGFLCLGIFEGSFPVVFLSFTAVLSGMLFYFHRYRNKEDCSLQERKRFLQVAWEYLKGFPLIGCGFDNYMIEAPHLRQKKNIDTNGEFLEYLNYRKPYEQYCHNDFLQNFIDNGIIGFGLITAVTLYTIMFANDPVILCAFLSLLFGGLFLHSFQFIQTNLLFWVLALMLIKTEGVVTVSPFVALMILPLSLLVWRFVVKNFISDYHLNRYFKTYDASCIIKSNAVNPCNSDAHVTGFNHFYNIGDYGLCLEYIIRAIGKWDGKQKLDFLWSKLGVILLSTGVMSALCSFGKSIEIMPTMNDEAYMGKSKIQELLKNADC